ncbi:MAG: acyl-CoA dehydrogenase family protein, partial [Endozoicomonadaceae bacterium]|nr:acyl-CoA dehydrogenase family protein [Endozoicomonadaceae bacterium]
MSNFYTDLNYGLNSELLLFRNQVAKFTDEEIAPIAAQIDEKSEFPAILWKKMGDLGLLGITVSESFGGSNAGYLAHVIAMEELSRGSASVALSYGAHSNLCVNQIYRHGTNQQKQKYLPPLIMGTSVGALAMSEVNSGSDVVSMSLNAQDKGDYFVLNGNKMWITNGPDADIIVVYAKTSPQKNAKGISAFIVERNFPGFKHAQQLNKLGMRGSKTSELVFENCEVPKENVLGTIDKGVNVLMSGLDFERVVLAGGPVGIMQACLDLALPYIHQRKQFGKPIGKFQLIQEKIANMYTTLNSCRSYLYTVARACDHQHVSRKDAASVILLCAEKATAIALDTIQVLGGNGYINEYPA